MKRLVLLIALACASGLGQTPPAPPAAPLDAAVTPPAAPAVAKPHFFFRRWPDWLVKFDPVLDREVAQVQFQGGVAHSQVLAHDLRRLFMTTAQRRHREVIGLATMKILDTHTFKQDGYIIRVDSVKECPGGTHWYVKVDRVKALPDHFVIEEPEWLYYRLKDQEIEKRSKELPKEIRSGARISPDGNSWHVFGRDLVILDGATLKETGKIELSAPLYGGMGALSVGGEDFFDGKNHKAYRMIYRMRDPVKKNRSLSGLVDLDLETMKIGNLVEWGSNVPGGRLEISLDKKIGVTESFSGGGRGRESGENEIRLITYDLVAGRMVREGVGKFRNGLGLAAVSPDGKKSYLVGRGHELVVLDEFHQPLRTIEFGGELDGSIITTVVE